MKNLKESEKNFLTCALMIGLVGIALLFLNQTTLGILSIISAVVFAAVAVRMIVIRKKDDGEEEEKDENGKRE